MSSAPRIYRVLLGAALRSELQYRANFLIMLIAGMLYQGSGFLFIWIIVERFESIADWTLEEVAFLYGLRLLAHSLWIIPFNRLIDLDWIIREGQFDRFLTRPLSPLLQLLTSRVRVSSFGDLLSGILLFTVANSLVDIDWSVWSLCFLVLAILGGAMIEAGLQLGIAALAFRLLNTESFRLNLDIVFSTFGNYPLKTFDWGVQFVLTFLLPLAFVAYLPATVLLDRTDELMIAPAFAFISPLVGMLIFFIAWRLWRRGVNSYQGTGH